MKTDPVIKVSLVDDHIVLRHALGNLIDASGSCKVIHQFNNGHELTRGLHKDNLPDVIILDMNMPVMNGYETSCWLHENYPAVRILMLTMYDSELALIRLLQAGVKGFMKKDIHPSELLFAIQSVMEHGYYYSSHTSSKLAGLFRETPIGQSPLEKILMDPTELEFLKHACTEMTYKEIARKNEPEPEGY